MKLNGKLIESLRTRQGLGPTHAGTIAGISEQALKRIEGDDENATSMLTVTGLLDLARALGVQPTDLLPTPSQTTPVTDANANAKDNSNPIEDHQALAGLLLNLKQQTTRTDIQKALGWTNERLKSVLPDLDAHLKGTGLTLHRAEARLELVPTNRQTVMEAQAGPDYHPTQQTRHGRHHGTGTPQNPRWRVPSRWKTEP